MCSSIVLCWLEGMFQFLDLGMVLGQAGGMEENGRTEGR